MYYIGGVIFLLGLIIGYFSFTRKIYDEQDYNVKQITVKECFLNKSNGGIIVATDDSKYEFSQSLFWKVGSVPELANRLCQQKKLNLFWLNGRYKIRISAFEGENFSIPIEVGIAKDNGGRNFLWIAFIVGMPGLTLMILAFYFDRKGKKLSFNV